LWMSDEQKPSSFFTRLFKLNHNRHSLWYRSIWIIKIFLNLARNNKRKK
jgi:hypothetical protein